MKLRYMTSAIVLALAVSSAMAADEGGYIAVDSGVASIFSRDASKAGGPSPRNKNIAAEIGLTKLGDSIMQTKISRSPKQPSLILASDDGENCRNQCLSEKRECLSHAEVPGYGGDKEKIRECNENYRACVSSCRE